MSEPPSRANASVGLMSTTLVTPPLTGTVTLLHEVPLKCSSTGATFRRSTPSVDAVPAAQMSDGDDPEIEVMSRSGSVVLIGSWVVVQVEPLNCSASPLLFTDHRSVAENAASGPSVTPAGMVICDHEVPLKWNATDSSTSEVPVSMMPVPSAVMLSAEVPVMKLTPHWLPRRAPSAVVHSPAGSPCPVQLVPFQCSNGSPVAPPTAQTSVGEAA